MFSKDKVLRGEACSYVYFPYAVFFAYKEAARVQGHSGDFVAVVANGYFRHVAAVIRVARPGGKRAAALYAILAAAGPQVPLADV